MRIVRRARAAGKCATKSSAPAIAVTAATQISDDSLRARVRPMGERNACGAVTREPLDATRAPNCRAHAALVSK
jgi:hypothetical protein